MNIAEIEMALAELVAQPFASHAFVFQMMMIFDAPKATVTRLRKAKPAKDDQQGDVFWVRKLWFRVAETGKAAEAVDALKTRKVAQNKTPRFYLATDGTEVCAWDSKIDETVLCDFAKLNDHFDFFLPLAGIDKYEAVSENPADIKAAGRLAKFHDEIAAYNPDWAAVGEEGKTKRHAMNVFLTRLLFCMFAEDTGSFEQDLFIKTITELGGEDGEQMSGLLALLFEVLDTAPEMRAQLQGVPAFVLKFPYVNGGLFAEKTQIPKFSKRAKRYLVEAAALDWKEINPDIFGSMIQAVVDDDMRGDLGMHYTSVPNIMKVLQPLFLMGLEEDFAAAGDNEKKLNKLLVRIAKIRVFDPACGSGNFLIIAYRELRKLEMRVFEKLKASQDQFVLPFSAVQLSNFYGIEIAGFAVETARLSLWIAQYQMNQKFKNLFGEAPPDFPLKDSGQIVHGNALRLDWQNVCPQPEDKTVETFIVGNPPYLGSTNQSKAQKDDMAAVFAPHSKSFKNLDYVAAWYFKAADYAQTIQAKAAFVATNSICQGQQVALLWPLIFERGMEIEFAHQSFKWKNLAAANAGVTCIIAGIGKPQKPAGKTSKKLFEGEVCRQVKTIGAYLIEMPDIIVTKASRPLNGLPPMDYGNKPTDGGHLILSPHEKTDLLTHYPAAEPLIRRFYGSQELIKGIERYCLWIKDADLPLAQSTPPVAARIEKVRDMRLASPDVGANKMASRSHQFREMNEAKEHAIIIPRVSSEHRPYLPVDILSDGAIIQDRAFAIYDGEVWVMAIIASKMHKVWIETVCVRLRSDFSYSNTLGYNTFPIPKLTDSHKQTLEDHAWAILAARAAHPGKTIAWLYNPKTMPAALLAAHQSLDDTLEKIYIGRPFKNDTERLEHLFKLYAKMTKQDAKGERV